MVLKRRMSPMNCAEPMLRLLFLISPVMSAVAVDGARGIVAPTPAPTVFAIPRLGQLVDTPVTNFVGHFDLFRRQRPGLDDPDCLNAGEHPCRAIGISGCCANNMYCYLDSARSPRCCSTGEQCGNNPCPSGSFLCSPSASGTNSCCRRPCAQTEYQCREEFGGQCCGLGSVCLSGNSCSPTTGLTLNGCSAGQISCPASLSGGCCNIGFACGFSANTPACIKGGGSDDASATAGDGEMTASRGPISYTTVPSSGDGNGNDNGSEGGGLSTGAKAGIGVSAGLGGLALLGAAAFLFIRSRRTIHVTPPPQTNGSAYGGGSGPSSNLQYASYAQPPPPPPPGMAAAVPLQQLPPGHQPPVPAYQEQQYNTYASQHGLLESGVAAGVASGSPHPHSNASPLPVPNDPPLATQNAPAELPTNVGLKGERSGPVDDFFPSSNKPGGTHELE